MSEEITSESLQKSIKTVGELYPILENQDGKILDGNHRVISNPKHHRKIIQTKNRVEEILVRLHAHHRRQVPQEETRALLIELAEELEKGGILKENVTAELYKIVPFSERYVRQLMPQEYKQPEKVEAAKVSAELTPQTVKTQYVECERCHVTTSTPQDWHGHKLCSTCHERAELNPKTYESFFRYAKKPVAEKPPVMVHEYKESWEHRKATMQPQVSNMEILVLKNLSAKGFTPQSQKAICIRYCCPDYYFELPQGPLAIFLDGPVHIGREDRDEVVREELTKRGVQVLSIPYESPSDKEAEEIAQKILETLQAHA